jgi:two-component system, NtrC family, nitrogen regulation response regulator GlnG
MSASATQVFVVDDDESIRWVLERALRNAGMQPVSFEAAEPALAALRTRAPDVLLTDVRMTGKSGLELMRSAHQLHPELPVVVMTAHSDLESAVAAYGSGAFEYLPKPFDIDQALDLVRRAADSVRPSAVAPADTAAAAAAALAPIPGLLGRAPAMQQVFRAIGRLSRSSVNVLVTGESGTGKELVARALHEHSPRAKRPFIALNTSAIPSELLESELFGHEKGAFTGADSQRRGRFEQADGGTLFLDEIGDMTVSLQTRLLRVLAENEFYRVGGQSPIRVDVRVIAATHQNLEERVRTGQFREDLFHRLNVIRVELPPLRARREDIPALLNHYLKAAAAELGVEPKVLSAAAGTRLQGSGWPGNVRELVNLCRRLTVLSPGNEVRVEDLPTEFAASDSRSASPEVDWTSALRGWAERQGLKPEKPLLDVAMPAFERTMIQVALRATQGHKQEAARLLGWGRNTLTRKLQELGMSSVDDAGALGEE